MSRTLLTVPTRPAFNPLVDPDLLHVSLALTASDNGTTLTMPDRSLRGTHLTATGGTGRAVISPNGFANKAGINFAAMVSGNAPLQSAALGALLSGKTAATILVLAGYGTTQTAGYMIAYSTTAPGSFRWLQRQPGAGQHQITWYDTVNATLTTPVAADTITVEEVCAAVFNATGPHKVASVHTDQSTLTPTYSPDTGPTSFSNQVFKVGSADNGSSPVKAIIAGVAVVSRALDDAEIRQWGAWMREQYGLATTPTRILHAGDSIVVGSADSGGWRRRTWNQYAADALAGSRKYGAYAPTGNIAGTYFLPDFCSGVSGSTVASTQARLTGTDLVSGVAYRLPEVVTIHAGINDIVVSGSTAAQVAAAWTTLLVAAYDVLPSARYKLFSMINNTMSGGLFTNTVIAANALGPQAIANAIAARPGLNAEWIDAIYTVTLDTDGEHPKPGDGFGYDQMYADYYPRIMGWLSP